MKVGWRNVALQEVADIERDIIDPSAITDGTTYIGLENIETGGLFVNVRSVTSGELASTKFTFTDKHILYGKLRPYLIKIARPTFSGICSTDILPILPRPELDRDYLSYFLRQPSMVDLATSRSTGANLPRLSPKILAEFSISLPPIAQQKRIAAILDKAEELRSLRRQALGALDAIAQSIFLEMFGDPATNPKKLPLIKLGDLTKISSGSTPSRAVIDNFGGTIPWVKTTEVCGTTILKTEEQITENALRNSSCRIYPAGSILVALYGQGKTRGRCAILGIDASTNQACGVLLPQPSYDTRFLFSQLTLAYERLRALGRGGNQENLNLGLLSDFVVLLPPISLQQEFARRVEAIEQLKTTHRQSLAQLNALFASLQHRAFRGDL